MTRSPVAVTAALIFLLGACGGGDGGEGAGPTGGTSAPSSAAAEPECSAVSTELSLVAENVGFDVDCLAVPADSPFTIELTNLDEDLSHDVAIADHPRPNFDELIFDGEVIGGSEMITYEVDGLPEGEYVFVCSVHINRMFGDLLVGQPA